MLRKQLGKDVRDAREAPFEENTPSSKQNFKKDGYTAYDKPCEDTSQQCYAHIMRRFERLLKKEPENKEYRAFVPKMCGLLSEAVKLRTKGLSPEDFAREAKRIRRMDHRDGAIRRNLRCKRTLGGRCWPCGSCFVGAGRAGTD